MCERGGRHDAREGGTGVECEDLTQALALLEAIELGELFAAAPGALPERARHAVGVSLLDMARARLQAGVRMLKVRA